MACYKFLVYSTVEGTWRGTNCGGSSVGGTLSPGEASYTECLQEKTILLPRGAWILWDLSEVCLETTPTPTPIVCGQGITQDGYYYTDCCGNFVEGLTSGQLITLNTTLPFVGITLLGIPASVICSTPQPTPTITSTPTSTTTSTITLTPSPSTTSTPTLTPTPTQTPAVRYINDCQVITIFPMGVECNIIQNPSSATSFDGILSVNVTGGTSPYSFYWNTGEVTQTINNLSPGDYTVLVVDFYGDFSATTVCSLIGPTPSPTPSYTPTMTPSPTLTAPNLCLIFVTPSSGVYQQLPLTFVPNGSQNGRQSWYNSTANVSIIWNSSLSRWEIPSWPYGGLPINTSQSLVPSSGWVFIGTPGTYVTIDSSIGNCASYAPLSYSLLINSSGCLGSSCTGSLFVNTTGGVPPYSYSIDGVTFQSSNIFTNLCPSTFGLTVKDSVNNTLQQTVVIPYDNTVISYTVGLVVDSIDTPNQGTQVLNWHATVTPPLAQGLTLYFDVVVSSKQQARQPYYNDAASTMTITSSSEVYLNNVSQSLAIYTAPVQVLPNICNPSTLTMEETNISETVSLSMTSSDYVNGKSTSIITILAPTSDLYCTSTGYQQVIVTLTNLSIVGSECALLVKSPTSTTIQNTVVGEIT